MKEADFNQTGMKSNDSAKPYILAFLLVFIVAILPVLPVKFLPCTDLPQHLCQTKAFYETVFNGSEIYKINFFGANTLVYYLMFLLWHFFSPLLTAKITIVILLSAGFASIFLIARKEKSSISNAVLACIFLFNSSFYWGFLPFMSGWPIFAVFWLLLARQNRDRVWQLKMLIVSFLLYLSHILWLLAGIGMLLIRLLPKWKTQKQTSALQTALPVLPVVLYSAYWFSGYSNNVIAKSRSSEIIYYFSPFERLFFPVLARSSNLSVEGFASHLILLLLLVYCSMTAFYSLKNRQTSFNKELLATSALGFAFYLLAPDYFLNTMLFSQRWLPYSIIFLLLSMPAIKNFKKASLSLAITTFLLVVLFQAHVWVNFEKHELSGLKFSLSYIPESKKLIWTDLKKKSKSIIYRPFIQIGAYFEALKSCKTNYSFTCHNTGIVSHKNSEIDRKQFLFPDHAKYIKEPLFPEPDYFLVNATEKQHNAFSTKFRLQSLNSKGVWRLYTGNTPPNELLNIQNFGADIPLKSSCLAKETKLKQ